MSHEWFIGRRENLRLTANIGFVVQWHKSPSAIMNRKDDNPSDAFERRRYMNVVVQRARHPELRDYIHSAASGLLPFIEKGLVERVAVIFFSEDNVPVERFIFKLTINPSCAALVEEGQLEFALRSFLIKLSVSKSLCKPLPKNCRWEVTVCLRSLPQVCSSKEGELWIPTDTKQWQKPPVITPVKSLNSQPLCLQLYLEHPSLIMSP